MQCPSCKGTGKVFSHVNTGPDSSKHYWGDANCFRCSGTGNVNNDWVLKGEEVRAERRKRDLSLLEASKILGVSPATLSSMETGKIEPAVSYSEVGE